MTTNTPAMTINQAKVIMERIKLPVPPMPTLQRIAKENADNFKRALTTASGTGDENAIAAAREYLICVLTAYSQSIGDVYRRFGFKPIEPQRLVQVAVQEGSALRAAIRTFAESPDNSEAVGYLKAVITQTGPEPLGPNDQNTQNNVQNHPAAANAPRQAQERSQHEPPPLPEEPPAAYSYEAGEPEPNKTRPEIESTHLYGGKAAFCFTKDKTQSGANPTITIDAARVFSGQQRKYDWKNKVAFQLTVGELPLVFGVFYGFLESIYLPGHGRTNNKALTIQDQKDKYFLSMNVTGEGSIAIPAISKDTFRVMGMLLEQMKLNFPGLDTKDVIAIVKRVCDKHVAPPARREAAA